MVIKLRQLLGDCTFLEAYERTGVFWCLYWGFVLIVQRDAMSCTSRKHRKQQVIL